MKKQANGMIALSFILFFLFFFFTLAQAVHRTASQTLPSAQQADYSLANQSQWMSAGDLGKLRQEGIWASGQYVENASLSLAGLRIPVACVYTDSAYETLGNVTMLRGTFLDSSPDGIVISSSLARQLYFTEDAVGLILKLNGREYRICGVYQENRNLAARLSAGAERIYFPYDSTDNALRFSHILYENHTGKPLESILQQSFYQRLQGAVGFQLREEGEFLTQFYQLIPLLLWVACILLGCRILLRLGRDTFERVRHRYSQGYGGYVLKKSALPVGGFLAAVGLLLAAVTGTYAVLGLHWEFPLRFLPQEQIFDFSGYGEKILALFKTYHLISPGLAQEPLSVILFFLLSLTAFLLCLVFTCLAVWRLEKQPFGRGMVSFLWYMGAMLSGSLGGFAVAAWMGLSAQFPLGMLFLGELLLILTCFLKYHDYPRLISVCNPYVIE